MNFHQSDVTELYYYYIEIYLMCYLLKVNKSSTWRHALLRHFGTNSFPCIWSVPQGYVLNLERIALDYSVIIEQVFLINEKYKVYY